MDLKELEIDRSNMTLEEVNVHMAIMLRKAAELHSHPPFTKKKRWFHTDNIATFAFIKRTKTRKRGETFSNEE